MTYKRLLFVALLVLFAWVMVGSPAPVQAADGYPVSEVAAPQAGTITFHVHTGAAPGTGRSGYRVHVYRANGSQVAWKDTGSGGDAVFTLDDGDYTYRVEKNGAYSAPRSFSVAGAALTVNHRLSMVTIKVGDHQDGIHQGYRVHVYRDPGGAGGEWAWKDSNASGLTTFYMVDGDYSYKVEKNGAYSAADDFDVTYEADAALEYKLSKIVVKVSDLDDGVHSGYRLHVYRDPNGAGGEWAWKDSNASGLTTFYMVEGDYSYRVEKNGAYSAADNFDVTYCNDATIIYQLAKVEIKVGDHQDGVHQGYRVHVYRDPSGAGGEWAWQDSNASGLTTFYMVDGDYSYRVEKNGAYGKFTDFDVAYGSDLDLEYKLSKVVIKVGDHQGGVHPGYRVHIYRDPNATGGEWAWKDSDASGLTTFYMVDGDYSYRVEKNGAYSAPKNFTVVYSNDYPDMEYKLSKVTINVTNKAGRPLQGFRVHVYRDPGAAGGEWAWQDSNASGLVTFYMVDGGYSYRVEEGCYWSGATDFTVTYSNDLPLTHVAIATVKVKVSDAEGNPHAGYRVYLYNAGSSGHLAYDDSGADGMTSFELDVLKDYEYVVSKGRRSQRVAFSTCGGATLTYELSKTDVKVAGAGGATYRVYAYSRGSSGHFAYKDVPADGTATFYLVDGAYDYRVSWGRGSARVSFDVTRDESSAPAVVTANDLTLTYELAKVDINVTGGGGATYRVYVYSDGSSGHFSYQDIPANGTATFYMVDGAYEYRVSWGRGSQRVDFDVTRSESGNTVTCGDKALTYNLAKVDINVTGGGGATYRVYVYSDGSSGHFSYKDIPAGGTATFYMVDGAYEYRVSWGRGSQRVDFDVTRSESGDTVTCADKALTYNLAKVDITVSGGGGATYRVYIYSRGSSGHFSYQDIPANGTATFYMVDGAYDYRVSWGRGSARVLFDVTRSESGDTVTCDDLDLTYELARIAIKVVDRRSRALTGFRVYLYSDGSSGHFSYQDTPASGEVVFYLVDGAYDYRVVKDCYNSGRKDLAVSVPPPADDQSIVHRATADVKITVSDSAGNGHKGYLVRLYNAGGSQIAYQWSDDNGLTTFELDALGGYEYVVEKNGARSARKSVAAKLCAPVDLEYELAKVVVNVSDNASQPHKGYLVRIYNGTGGSGSQWGYQWSNDSGQSTFYLIEGDYGYLVEKNGARSAKYGFTVDPPASPADDQAHTYKLAKITVHVSDTVGGNHKGYLVRVYNGTDGGGSQWGYAWSDSNGHSTFYLIEGDYGYLVEKNGARSAKYDFDVTAGATASDDTHAYELAKITVHVSDTDGDDHKGYLVRVYNGLNGSGSQWGYAWSDSVGNSTFYLIEGNYGYLVEKNGAKSPKYGFTVDPPASPADDQTLTYKLAKITVHVSDNDGGDHKGYLVRVYNGQDGGGSQWGYAWSDSNGHSIFYLIEGNYGYLIEKNGARSGKYDFDVTAGATASDETHTYNLAEITIIAPGSGYLVRVYNMPANTQWGYQWSDASGNTVFYLIEGDYRYRIEQSGSVIKEESFTVDPPSSPAHDMTLNSVSMCTLTVSAPNGTYVEIWRGSKRVTTGYVDSTESRAFDLPADTYTVKLRQGSAWVQFTADCSGASQVVDALATLTVEAPNGTYVEVWKNSARVTTGRVGSGKEVTLKTLRYDDYKVKLRQGSAWTNFTGIDVSGGTDTLEALRELTLEAPSGTYVEVWKGSARATTGNIGSTKSLKLDVVKSAGYTLRYRQGSVWVYFADIDCTDDQSHSALATLTVDKAPKGVYVEVWKNTSRAKTGYVDSTKTLTLDVLKTAGYTVKLRQGSVWNNFGGVSCADGTGSLDALQTLTVIAPKGAYVEVWKGSARATTGYVPTGNALTLDLVRSDDYRVKIRQGSVWNTFTDVDVNASPATLDALCSLTVKAIKGTYIEVWKGSARAVAGYANSAGLYAVDVVKCDDYTVKLRYSGKWYAFNHVDCKSACPCVLDKSKLEVQFPDMKLTRVTIKNQAGGTVTYRDWPEDAWTFDLDPGVYDVVLQHGAKTKVVEDVVVLGEVKLDGLVSNVTLHFEGIKMTRVTVKTTTGGTVTYKDWPQNTWSVTLLKNTYTVVFQHGAATREVTLDATGNTGTVVRDDVVCDLTVDFAGAHGLRLNRVTIKTPSGGTVTYKDWPVNQWSVPVLQNTYDVMLQHGAEVKIAEDVDCTGTSKTLDDLVSDVTLNFDGMKMTRVTIQTTGGDTVTYKDWPQDAWELTLLKSDYKVLFQHGAATRVVTLDANGDTGEVIRDEVVCDLTVNFAGAHGLRLNRVTIKTPGGGTVTYKDWPVNQWVVPVLQNTYDVVLQHGAAVKTASDVECTGTSKTLEDLVSDVTIAFPGMKLNRVTIKTKSGGTVTYKDWPQDAWQLTLLKGEYDVVLQHGAKVKTVALDATGDTGTVEDIVCTLTIEFPGMKANRVTIKTTSGGTVTYKDWPQNAVSFVLLKNHYKVELNVGGKIGTVDVDCTGDTCIIDSASLTINAPNGTDVEVRTPGGVRVAGGRVGTSKHITFNNLDIGVYDIVLTQGAASKTLADVLIFGDLSFDELCVLTVKAPNGTNVEVRSGGRVTGGRVGTSKQIALDVLKGTYGLHLSQGAATKDVSGVVCTGETAMQDELAQLTVNAPNGTDVEVRVPDSTGKVTGGRVGTSKYITLDVVRGVYDVYLKQNAADKTTEDVDVNNNKSIDELCVLLVKAPNGTDVEVRSGGNRVTGTRIGTSKQATLDVVKGTYDLYLKQGAGENTVSSVDCSGDNAEEAQLTQVTVNAPNGTDVEVRVKGSTGKVTGGRVGTSKHITLDVVKGAYDVYLKQGAATKTVVDVDVNANTSIDELCVLTVKAPNGTDVEVRNSGSRVTGGHVGTSKQIALDVVKGTYDLHLSQGAGTKDVTGVACMAETAMQDELTTLQVNAPNGTDVEVRVKDGTGKVTGGRVGTSKVIALDVVKNVYDVYLKQGAATKTTEDVDVNNDHSIDELCVLTIAAPNGTDVEVRSSGSRVTGGRVGTSKQIALDVVKGTYDLHLSQGAGDKDISGVDCTGETVAQDELCVLTVSASNGTDIEVLVPTTSDKVTGGRVGTSGVITLDVVKNTYDVSDGSVTKSVDCSGDTASVAFP